MDRCVKILIIKHPKEAGRLSMSENNGAPLTGRFVYLVEDKFSYHLETDDLTVVAGTVHGTVNVHDRSISSTTRERLFLRR